MVAPRSRLRLALRGGLAAWLALAAVALASPDAEAADKVVLDRILAVVNDEIILQSELETALQQDPRVMEALQGLGPNPTQQQVELKLKEMRTRLLDDLIDRQLILDEAERFGMEVTEADVRRALNYLARENGLASVAELRKVVEESGQFGTWDDYTADLRENIKVTNTLQALVTVSVTDAQVREEYRKMSRGEDARVLLVKFEFRPQGEGNAARDEALKQAQSALRRLNTGEAPEKVGADLKQDASPLEVGRGQVPPAVEDAIFAARKGQVIGPLESGQGFVVIKVVDQLDSDVLPFDQVEDRIRVQLEQEARAKAQEELFRQLRAKAHLDLRV